MYTLKRIKDLICSFNQMRIKYYKFRLFVNIISYAQFPCKLQPETQTPPIISLIISWFEDYCFRNKKTYKLVFELNLQLTLNITFNKLITRDYFGTCNQVLWNNVTFQCVSSFKKCFFLCTTTVQRTCIHRCDVSCDICILNWKSQNWEI